MSFSKNSNIKLHNTKKTVAFTGYNSNRIKSNNTKISVDTKEEPFNINSNKHPSENYKKFDMFLKNLKDNNTKFKAFSEKKTYLKNNLLSLQDNNNNFTLKDHLENNSASKILNSLSSSLQEVNKPSSVLEIKQPNTNFSFKNLKNNNIDLYKKNPNILKTLDITPENISQTKVNQGGLNDNIEDKNPQTVKHPANNVEMKPNLMLNDFTPYFTKINNDLTAILSELKNNSAYLMNSISVKLSNLEKSILSASKHSNIDGLHNNDSQNTFKSQDLNNVIKAVNTTALVKTEDAYVAQKDDRTEISVLASQIGKLETKITDAINSKTEELLNKLQNIVTSRNENNKNELLNRIKDIFNLCSSLPDARASLENSINNIRLKQDDLLKNAIAIKEQVINNSKEIDIIKDAKKEHNKIFDLVTNLQNNHSFTEEQNSFNAKIHQDMELIKKNIVKLIQDQQTGNKNNINKQIPQEALQSTEKLPNSADYKQDNAVDNKHITKQSSSNEIKKPVIKNNINKLSNNENFNKRDTKPTHVEHAISKLKEALDLDGIEYEETKASVSTNKTVKNNSTKADKPSTTVVSDKPLENPNKNNEDSQKNIQKKQNNIPNKVFVLDNSKFFK